MVISQGRRRAHAGAAQGGVARRFLRQLDQDSTIEGLGPRWGRAIFWLPVYGTLAIAVPYLIHRPWLYWLLRDDHPVEWAQFAFILFAGLVAVVVAVRLARRGRRDLSAVLVLVAVACLIIGGEEISWAQRVFAIDGPAALVEANLQKETNLHNLVHGGFSALLVLEVGELILGVVAVVLGLLARPARSRLHLTKWWWLAPPLCTLPSFAVIALYRAFMLATDSNLSPAIVYQEFAEFCFYAVVAVTIAAWYARAAEGRYVLDVTGAVPTRYLKAGSTVGLRPVIVIAAGVVLLTVVFAVLSAYHDILPGNVPGAHIPGGARI